MLEVDLDLEYFESSAVKTPLATKGSLLTALELLIVLILIFCVLLLVHAGNLETGWTTCSMRIANQFVKIWMKTAQTKFVHSCFQEEI